MGQLLPVLVLMRRAGTLPEVMKMMMTLRTVEGEQGWRTFAKVLLLQMPKGIWRLQHCTGCSSSRVCWPEV